MVTHIKFKKKTYSSISNIVKKYGTLPIATASLGVSSANLATNLHRNKKEAEFRKEQLQATKDLTDSLLKVDKSLKKNRNNNEESNKKSRIIRFIPLNKLK